MSDTINVVPSLVTHPSGDQRFAVLDETMRHYNHDRDSLIQVLHAAQQLFGYLGVDVLKYVATQLKLPLAHVYGVVTFYHLFTTVPRGKHQIMVCRGTACHVRGAQQIMDRLQQQLGVEEGQTTKDGMFSLHSARCIGACAMAPAIAIGDDVYGKLSSDKIAGLCRKELKKYV
jgi:bidirectional [NiFe] hydrogenase diaphorase subunit